MASPKLNFAAICFLQYRLKGKKVGVVGLVHSSSMIVMLKHLLTSPDVALSCEQESAIETKMSNNFLSPLLNPLLSIVSTLDWDNVLTLSSSDIPGTWSGT